MLQYASTSLTSSSTSLQYSPPSTLQVPAPPAAPLPRRETCVRDCCRFITLSCPRPAPGKPPPGLTSASSSPAGVGRRAVQRTVRPAHMPCGLEPDSDEATSCGEASNPPQHQQTRYQGIELLKALCSHYSFASNMIFSTTDGLLKQFQ